MISRLAKELLPRKWVGTAAMLAPPRRRTFSGSGEDIQVERLLGDIQGFYVDIGAFHPKWASNTHLLYRRGWSGINLDADEYKIALFRTFRRRDISLSQVAGQEKGVADFYFHEGGSFGSMSSLSDGRTTYNANRMGRTLSSRKVDVDTLNSILEKNLPAQRKDLEYPIDFLNIDVEGSEFDILSVFDIKKYPVRLMAIEIHGHTLDDVLKARVSDLLRDWSYVIVAWTPPTVFFMARAAVDQLLP